MTSYEEAYAYLERHVDALKTNRTGDERQTDAEVFDKKTLLTIYDMMTSRGCPSTWRATPGSEGSPATGGR